MKNRIHFIIYLSRFYITFSNNIGDVIGQFNVLVINCCNSLSFVCSCESQYLLKANLRKSRMKYRSHVDLFTDGQRCVVNVERGQFWTDFSSCMLAIETASLELERLIACVIISELLQRPRLII